MKDIFESENYKISYRAVDKIDGVKIFTNNDYIKVNNEINFDIESMEKSSIDFLAASLIGSIMESLKSQAKKSGCEIYEMEAKSEFIIKNPLTLLNVKGYEENTYISSCSIVIYYYTDNEEFSPKEYLEKSLMYKTLKNAFDIDVKFQYQL